MTTTAWLCLAAGMTLPLPLVIWAAASNGVRGTEWFEMFGFMAVMIGIAVAVIAVAT
jgi:hypothetical protein